MREERDFSNEFKKLQDRIAETLIEHQQKCKMSNLEMSVQLDISSREYDKLIDTKYRKYGCSLYVLYKIIFNTSITCCDIFKDDEVDT